MALTVISLVFTTYTTVQSIPTATNKETGMRMSLADIVTGGTGDVENKSGAVSTTDVNPTEPAPAAVSTDGASSPYSVDGMKWLFVQVSIVFLLISGYFAMILTNWATLQTSTSISNPKTGSVAMWIQAAGQWIAIAIYLWSLVAPKLFPDRDFGN